ncbi:hypothetical protein C0995_012678, partial [Termitomyces sp. Mi166
HVHGLYLNAYGAEHSVVYNTNVYQDQDGDPYFTLEFTNRAYDRSDRSICPYHIELCPNKTVYVRDVENLIIEQRLNRFVINTPQISGCKTWAKLLVSHLQSAGYIAPGNVEAFDATVTAFTAKPEVQYGYWVADETGAGPVP